MQLLKKIAFYCLVSALCCITVSTYADTNLSKKSKDVNYLFIENSDKGTLQKSSDGKTYTLTLHGIDSWVTYFSDVPHRITGMMSIQDFSKMMNQESSKKYPQGLNTGLVAIDSSNQQKVRYMMSLSNAHYDTKDNSVTFTAHTLPGKHRDPLPDNANFQHPALFVDGICISCSGGP